MSIFVGPVNNLGHPFPNLHEAPIERRIGDHLVYAFGDAWLHSKLKIVPAEPVEAVLLWDPGWLRDGRQGYKAFDEIAKVRALADEWDCPVFGLASDWFATWGAGGGTGMYGMMGAFKALDGMVIDHVGAATLRSTMPSNIVFDHSDYRYRPIVELTGFLHAGRLPKMGREDPPSVRPIAERSLDVCVVSNLYQGLVVHRAYFIEAAREICDRRGWSFMGRNKVKPAEMERLYLDSKVVLNIALGTQANCRVYEALACGATLVTDNRAIDLGGAPGCKFGNLRDLESGLYAGIHAPPAIQQAGLEWAARHTPEIQWAKVFDAMMPAIEKTREARLARRAWQEEMDAKALTAPRTNDGRPVILV